MKHFIFVVLLLCLATSCESGLVYEHKSIIKDGVWNFDAPLVFEVNALDSTNYYELFVEINHNIDFSYENFYVKISTEFPDESKLFDIVSFQLADNYGTWNGKCSGNECYSELILQEGFRFKLPGKHLIFFENESREVLNGINSITLKLYSLNEM